MKRNFDIFVDSAANLTNEMIEKYAIKVISYTYTLDGQEHMCYEEGVPFDEVAQKFYAAMREGAEPKTTLINEQRLRDAINPSIEAGRDVLLITITTKLSGTYNQAIALKKLYAASNHDRKFIVVDCFNAGMAEGLLACYAAQLAEEGKSIDFCGEWLEQNKINMNSYVTLSSLKYLKRSGRISSAVAVAGTLLNIKPIVWGSEKGILEVLCNERGRKKAIGKLVELFKANVIDPENQVIAIAHADCLDEAEELAERIREAGAKNVVINMYDLCTGANIGPGTLALFFMGKPRDHKEKQSSGIFAAFKKKFSANAKN